MDLRFKTMYVFIIPQLSNVGNTFLNSHSAFALGEQLMFKGHFTFIRHNQRNVTIKIS